MRDVTMIVTGGSMGIGLACARQLVRGGYDGGICARGRGGGAAAAGEGEFERVLAGAEELGPVEGVVHAAAVLGPIGHAVEAEAGAWLGTGRGKRFGRFLGARRGRRAPLA